MGLSILFFAKLVSVFRSRFLVLITPAHPEDWPLSPPTVDVTAWVGGCSLMKPQCSVHSRDPRSSAE